LISCRVVRGSRWKQLSDHNPVVAEFREEEQQRIHVNEVTLPL